MARNRMLNPEFWLDEEMAELSPHTRLLYMGLWGICDDNFATFPNRPDWIKAQVFPYEELEIKNLLKELEKIKKIIEFVNKGDNKSYWFIVNFFKHQRVDKPSRPKFPEAPSEIRQGTLNYSSMSPRPKDKISKDKISKDNYTIEFLKFWNIFPNRTGKIYAFKCWNNLKPNKDLQIQILKAIENQKKSSKWLEDGGRYIPNPSTWLNQGRWEDEVKNYPDKNKPKNTWICSCGNVIPKGKKCGKCQT